MDSEALVNDDIVAGEGLVHHLIGVGFPLVAAFWAKTETDDRWYLYLASPEVDAGGPRIGYDAVEEAVAAVGGAWSGPRQTIPRFTVKVLETTHPLTQAVLDVMKRFPPGPIHTWHRIRYLRGYPVEGTFIYALPQPAPATA